MNSSELFNVYQLPSFEKDAAKIISSYPEFKQDLTDFSESLSKNPEQGKHLGSGVFKVRLDITVNQPVKVTEPALFTPSSQLHTRCYCLRCMIRVEQKI
jgi:hypothetical protein